MFKKLLKKWKCPHTNKKTITNIYGDSINFYNTRSVQICEDCHKIIFSKNIDKNCNNINRINIRSDDCDTL